LRFGLARAQIRAHFGQLRLYRHHTMPSISVALNPRMRSNSSPRAKSGWLPFGLRGRAFFARIRGLARCAGRRCQSADSLGNKEERAWIAKLQTHDEYIAVFIK
jgi:hypothetical protein